MIHFLLLFAKDACSELELPFDVGGNIGSGYCQWLVRCWKTTKRLLKDYWKTAERLLVLAYWLDFWGIINMPCARRRRIVAVLNMRMGKYRFVHKVLMWWSWGWTCLWAPGSLARTHGTSFQISLLSMDLRIGSRDGKSGFLDVSLQELSQRGIWALASFSQMTEGSTRDWIH